MDHQKAKMPKITLEAARVNAHYTQKEAAKRLEISTTTLQSYEAGRTTPDWAMVRKIEALYDYPIDYIFLP